MVNVGTNQGDPARELIEPVYGFGFQGRDFGYAVFETEITPGLSAIALM